MADAPDAFGADAALGVDPPWQAIAHPRKLPDLGRDIGSGRWFGELVILLVLMMGTLAFWPDFDALPQTFATPGASISTIAPLTAEPDRAAAFGPHLALLGYIPERPRLDISVVREPGESLTAVLRRAGLGDNDAMRAAAKLASEAIVPGTRIAVALGRLDRAVAHRRFAGLELRPRLDLALRLIPSADGLTLQRRTVAVDNAPLRLRGRAGDSVSQATRAAGLSAAQVQDYLQALDRAAGFDWDLRPGDTFDLVLARQRAADGAMRLGGILYAAIERDGAPRIELGRASEGERFAAAGSASPSLGFGRAWPVDGRMTSGFGLRLHPILGYLRLHAGIDFAAPWGSPIHAAAAGIVGFAGFHGGHGNYVRVDHAAGLASGYGHMSRIAVPPGARVRTGQVIGYVGSTGLSTGPHLHFEVLQDGHPVDPLSLRQGAVVADSGQARLALYRALVPQARVGLQPSMASDWTTANPIAAVAR